MNTWIDQVNISPGQKWDTEIQKALTAADCLLFIMSKASVASDNVLDEVNYALNNKKAVFPILMKDCEMPYRVSRLQHIDFTNDYATGLDRLLEALKEYNAEKNIKGQGSKITGEQPSLHTKPPQKRSLVKKNITALVICIAAVVAFYFINDKEKTKAVPAAAEAARKDTPVQSSQTPSLTPAIDTSAAAGKLIDSSDLASPTQAAAFNKFKELAKSFDLNPSKPLINLRFVSKKYDFTFGFTASQSMKLETLMEALITHFSFDKTIKNKEDENDDKVSAKWIMLVNYKPVDPFAMYGSIKESNLKPNDIISLKKTFVIERHISPM